MEYRNRKSLLDVETALRLGDDAIEVVPATGPATAIPYQDVEGVRLQFAPSRVQTGRYLADVHVGGRRRLRVCNERYEGPLRFADQSADYRRWVIDLHRRLAPAAPACRYRAGHGVATWWAYLVLSLAVYGGLAAILLGTRPDLSWSTLAKLVIVAFFLPVLIGWFRRNRPSVYRPESVPEDVLPPASDPSPDPGLDR